MECPLGGVMLRLAGQDIAAMAISIVVDGTGGNLDG
jgi:hypothetical protein